MPAKTNHQVRRQEVATIAADLMAAGGLAAVTNRGIAAAAGCSTTLVSHYFADKRDLVFATYQEVGDRVATRLQAAADAPSHRLRHTLEALLPLDEDRRRDWRLLFAFLGVAATDPELRAEQRARLESTRQHIRQILDEEKAAGTVHSRLDSAASATGLLSLVLGLGMQASFDADAWPPQRLRRVLRTDAARWTGDRLS